MLLLQFGGDEILVPLGAGLLLGEPEFLGRFAGLDLLSGEFGRSDLAGLFIGLAGRGLGRGRGGLAGCARQSTGKTEATGQKQQGEVSHI